MSEDVGKAVASPGPPVSGDVDDRFVQLSEIRGLSRNVENLTKDFNGIKDDVAKFNKSCYCLNNPPPPTYLRPEPPAMHQPPAGQPPWPPQPGYPSPVPQPPPPHPDGQWVWQPQPYPQLGPYPPAQVHHPPQPGGGMSGVIRNEMQHGIGVIASQRPKWYANPFFKTTLGFCVLIVIYVVVVHFVLPYMDEQQQAAAGQDTVTVTKDAHDIAERIHTLVQAAEDQLAPLTGTQSPTRHRLYDQENARLEAAEQLLARAEELSRNLANGTEPDSGD